MIFAPIEELEILKIYNRGDPNEECIGLYANMDCNAGCFGVLLGLRHPNGLVQPIVDNLFWLGDGQLRAGDHIFLYTGTGAPRTIDTRNRKNKIYTVHWGKSTTLFANSDMTAVLFRVDATSVAPEPQDVPQGITLEHK